MIGGGGSFYLKFWVKATALNCNKMEEKSVQIFIPYKDHFLE